MSIKFIDVPKKVINPKYEETKNQTFFESKYLIELDRAKRLLKEFGEGVIYDEQIYDVKTTPLGGSFHFLVPLSDSLNSVYESLIEKLLKFKDAMNNDKTLVFSNYDLYRVKAEEIRQLSVWFDHYSDIFFGYFMYIHREDIYGNNLMVSEESACIIKQMIYNDLNMYISQKRA